MSVRESILREMGLGPIWRLRDAPEAELPDVELPDVETDAHPEHSTPKAAPSAAPDAAPRRLSSEMLSMAREANAVADATPASVPAASRENTARAGDLDWDALTQTIQICRDCSLCEQRTQAVPGVGDRQADWLIVGEGPGAEEDARGEPFMGKAGKLLDAMLSAIGLARGENVYLTNAVKCRPPMNRPIDASELAACAPYLARQIALIKPRLIVVLGRPAAQALLNTDIRIASARGRCFDYHGIPVVVTYHPAYLLRNPLDKAKAWEDLCFARRQMRDRSSGNGDA
ncbi:MAG: uracil-DNA glycosylase [Denitromonas halophila]|nr:MAG: uracil-DNA glycosylase [Denitromonas halophila]TVT74928.1 MAG: uracil-DNA glycosylase [Denitromonas halophila]